MFGAPKVTEVNAILARAWEECGSLPAQGKDHKHPTTYTLRRSFVRAIIKRCTDADGVTDWPRACKFTLHKNEKTLKAYYAGHVSDEMEDLA